MISWSTIKYIRYVGWAVCIAGLVTDYSLGACMGIWLTMVSYMMSFSRMETLFQSACPDTNNSVQPHEEGK